MTYNMQIHMPMKSAPNESLSDGSWIGMSFVVGVLALVAMVETLSRAGTA